VTQKERTDQQTTAPIFARPSEEKGKPMGGREIGKEKGDKGKINRLDSNLL